MSEEQAAYTDDVTKKRINPYKLFVGSFIPNWLLCRPELGQGAKLTYARLAQYAGEHGVAWPKRETIAAELGASIRNVDRYISELEKHHLIETKRPGLQQPNQYYFLDHEWMHGDSNLDKNGDSNLDKNGDSESSILSTPSMKRIIRRGSLEEDHRVRAQASPAPPTPADVDTAFLQTLATEHQGIDVYREHMKWHDYLLASGRKYKDYRAAFRNWLRKEEDNGTPTRRNGLGATPARTPGAPSPFAAYR